MYILIIYLLIVDLSGITILSFDSQSFYKTNKLILKCDLYCYFLSLACELKCNQIIHNQETFARLYSYQIEYDDGIFISFLSYIDSKALADLFLSFSIPIHNKPADDQSLYLMETNENQLEDKKWQSIIVTETLQLTQDTITIMNYPALLYLHLQDLSFQHHFTFSIMNCQVLETLVLENKCCNDIQELKITSMINIKILN